ncbi:aminoacyl-histidine dipeptidase [Bacteroidota bacterium]
MYMNKLEPALVWKYFDDILKIPRISKNEEQIIAYLEQFAKDHGLAFKKDSVGNCLLSKAALKGFEKRQTVILQSHLDMVGEKLAEVDHDFSTDPIKAVVRDGWMYAEGTTLGADDGIGVAASLAILASDNLKHGPLECLFTVDEETGMTGAFGIQEGFFSGKILLNLDSEEEGELFIGCAGGIDTVGTFKMKSRKVNAKHTAITIKIGGLRGGHSGDEIHKGYGNAIKLLTLILWKLDKDFSYRLVSINGGKLRNAIPREAEAIVVMARGTKDGFIKNTELIVEWIKELYKDVDPDISLEIQETEITNSCMKREVQNRLIHTLYACPNGVISWSRDIEGLVQTSTNLAVIKDLGQAIEVVTSQRSSSTFEKTEISDRIEALFRLAKGKVMHSDGYPGWKPNPNSQILELSKGVYKKLFDKDPEIKAIHAGLECGLFLEKYPDLDMVSFGPTIRGAHTPEERIEIASVQKFWDFLLGILESIPA